VQAEATGAAPQQHEGRNEVDDDERADGVDVEMLTCQGEVRLPKRPGAFVIV
jgi:hypothetical protein